MRHSPILVAVSLLTLAASVGIALARPGEYGQVSLKRGAIERQGNAWVERSICSATAREGGRVVLRAEMGSVNVQTGSPDRIECEVILRAYTSSESQARRYFASYELSARVLEGGGLYLSSKSGAEDWHSRSLSAQFNFRVPERFNLDLETQGGDVSLAGQLQGEVRATTAGGDIHTGDVNGPVHVETAGGNITLGNIAQGVGARTAGGSIHVGAVKGETSLETSGGEIATGRIEGTLRAETAGGDVVVAGATGPVVAETAGGQIRIGPATGSVRAQTAGGSVRLDGARGRVVVETAGGGINLFQLQGPVRASTAAGPILVQFTPELKDFGASQLETSMGDVQVYLPPQLRLTIEAAIEAAGGHGILSDFPLVIKGDKDEFAAREIQGRGEVNGGGQVLRIRTVNGNIEIRKLDARALEQLKARQDQDRERWQSRAAEKERRQREREERRRARQKQQE